jgi:hypothetical protein
MDNWIDLEDNTPDQLGTYNVQIIGLDAESTQRESLAIWGGFEFTLNNEDLKSFEYIAKWKPGKIREEFYSETLKNSKK